MKGGEGWRRGMEGGEGWREVREGWREVREGWREVREGWREVRDGGEGWREVRDGEVSDPDPPCSTGCKFLITQEGCVVTTILLTLHENRTIQNKLTTRSVPDPPVRAGDEKHTSSAARWVWARD